MALFTDQVYVSQTVSVVVVVTIALIALLLSLQSVLFTEYPTGGVVLFTAHKETAVPAPNPSASASA